jgi:flavin reductase (DIM6/NTAB) family NADH-FMN oxidoreductase RutF
VTEEQVQDGFRQAMRRLATTVALITSGQGDQWTGMAATAVVSICADPPTLMVAVNRTASLHPTLHAEKRFCVNLLSERHRDLVPVFGGRKKGLARFETGNWAAGYDGLPVLTDALASLTCWTETTLDVGTHTLFIGRVEHVANHDNIDPLIWVDGGFAGATRG